MYLDCLKNAIYGLMSAFDKLQPPVSGQIKTQITRGGASRRLSLFGFYVLTRMATAIIHRKTSSKDVRTKNMQPAIA